MNCLLKTNLTDMYNIGVSHMRLYVFPLVVIVQYEVLKIRLCLHTVLLCETRLHIKFDNTVHLGVGKVILSLR